MQKSFFARKRSTPHLRRPSFRRLCSEPLEARQLLAITVDTLVDEADGSIDDGDVSLRDAIALAPSGETIDFSVTGTILLTLGELLIDKDLTIDGPGAEMLTIDASGNDPTPDSTLDDGDDTNDGDGSRVFNIDDRVGGAIDTLVEISGLTLIGGDVTGDGGAIRARASLIVSDASVSANSASNDGGGIYARDSVGALVIERAVVVDNSAGRDGGGIWLGAHGTFSLISNSMIASNSALGIVDNNAGCGGGIYVRSTGETATVFQTTISDNYANSVGGGICIGALSSSTVSITASTILNNRAFRFGGGGVATVAYQAAAIVIEDSTISGNVAEQYGGGGVAHTAGPLFIKSSTITFNESPGGRGGGLQVSGAGFGIAYVASTIVAGNTGFDVETFDAPNSGGVGVIESQGHNLIGAGNATAAFIEPGDQTGIIDPMLGPLQDNGGPTLTHAPLPGSPVIDAGDPAFVAPPHTDQRGYYRVVDGDGDTTATIDIGAVEYASVPPLPGDGNLDQVVDGLDYVVWAMNYGDDPADDPPGSPLNGDYNDDGVVDGLDYVLWAIHFGESVAMASAVRHAALVEAALESEVDATTQSSTGGSLLYRGRADDGDATLAVDAVFEDIAVKKRLRRRGR